MLMQIIVCQPILPDEQPTIYLKYTAGRRRFYDGTPRRLFRLSRILGQLLRRWPKLFACKPFYGSLPGYVVFRRT